MEPPPKPGGPVVVEESFVAGTAGEIGVGHFTDQLAGLAFRAGPGRDRPVGRGAFAPALAGPGSGLAGLAFTAAW